jgi:hypothetical protein
VFAKLWHRFRQGNKRREQLKDDAAVDEYLRRQEASELERSPADLKAERGNVDWTYFPPP